jgi:hypothetical protein
MPYPVRILPTSSENGPCTRKITSKIKDRQHIITPWMLNIGGLEMNCQALTLEKKTASHPAMQKQADILIAWLERNH